MFGIPIITLIKSFGHNTFKCLILLASNPTYLQYFTETDKEKYDAIIGVATTLLAPAQLRMAKLALSMHITSPAVRMFDQIAVQNGAKESPCTSFVAIASKNICEDEVLKDILKGYDQYKPVRCSFYSFYT